MLEIVTAASPADLDAVRAIIREFLAWHRRRHTEDLALIDQYFDNAAFEAELAGLPGFYAPPDGRLLLARFDGQPAGCVALHALGPGVCEMKRMFVYERFHGKGVGRGLAEAIVREAKSIGYAAMRLDTSFRQVEALGLYTSLGFRPIAPYDELPPEMVNWLRFMELDLTPST